jgi:hypothetical protein
MLLSRPTPPSSRASPVGRGQCEDLWCGSDRDRDRRKKDCVYDGGSWLARLSIPLTSAPERLSLATCLAPLLFAACRWWPACDVTLRRNLSLSLASTAIVMPILTINLATKGGKRGSRVGQKIRETAGQRRSGRTACSLSFFLLVAQANADFSLPAEIRNKRRSVGDGLRGRAKDMKLGRFLGPCHISFQKSGGTAQNSGYNLPRPVCALRIQTAQEREREKKIDRRNGGQGG